MHMPQCKHTFKKSFSRIEPGGRINRPFNLWCKKELARGTAIILATILVTNSLLFILRGPGVRYFL